MLNRLIFAAVALAALLGVSAGACAQDRFALVIGNSNYETVPALPNPAKDAEATKVLLTEAGFDVTSAVDLGQSEMLGAVRDFAAKLGDKGKDSVALIYFAGHGLQIDGENYLLPVDAKITREADVPLEAVRLADIMNLLDAVPSKTRIVILDACRNDPFDKIAGKTGHGLALVNAPAGSVVAYSTSPGATAEDGTGNNSPFTAAFVTAAKVPGAPIETVFQNVRLAVHKTTEGRQTPWEVMALTEPFAFFAGQSGVKPEPAPEKTEAEWQEDLRSRSPQEAYDIVVRQDNVIVYQLFLVIFPDTPWGPQITLVLERRLEMFAWFDAVRLNSIAAYAAFLSRYPKSDLAPTAKRLKERAEQLAAFASSVPDTLGLTSKPEVQTVVQKVFVPSPPEIKTVIKEVPVEKLIVKEVIKEVKVPVEKIVVKEVPVEKIVVKEVKVPVEKVVIKEVIKEVKVPVEKIVIKEVIREVKVPVEKIVVKEVVKVVRVPVPGKCTGTSPRGQEVPR